MEDELTPEEENLRYLQDNPATECGLWVEWVCVCLSWEKQKTPTSEEWKWLKSRWYHNKWPIDSAKELIELRNQNED